MKRIMLILSAAALSAMVACAGSGKKKAPQFACPESQQRLDRELLAAAQHDVEKTAALIRCGANVNARDSYNGWTPLMHAAFKARPEIVRLLLRNGANVNLTTTDRYRRTALQYAMLNRNDEVIMLLRKAGARR